MKSVGRSGLFCAAIAFALAPTPWCSLAVAQDVQDGELSVQSLVDSLTRPGVPGATSRAFSPTQAPDTATNLCTGGRRASKNGSADAAGRNLEVVPYGDEGSANVNLDLQFELGSDKLSPADRSQLTKLATALRSDKLRNERFAVAGHTDTSGDEHINLQLSCARALSAQRFLVGQGIAATRLTAYGFGSQRLLSTNPSTDSRNRRVEIRKPSPS